MKTRLDRIISIATLLASMVAIILVLKRPTPVPAPQATTVSAEHAESNDQKSVEPREAEQPAPASVSYGAAAQSTPFSAPAATVAASQPATSSAKSDPHINSDEVSAAVAKMLGGEGSTSLSPDSNVGSGEPTIKDQQVTMDGDVIHGKFLTEIGGKDVWVTISGHMGEKDGYATFDPTEFKVGNMDVPVSLVNPALQRKLAEQRDRLKVPSN
jgi:hypothetical protein